MTEIPQELRHIKGATLEKIRRAMVRVLEEPETRESTKVITVDRVRGAGAGDQNASQKALKAWREGRLSVVDSWDTPPPSAGKGTAAAEGGDDDQRARLAKRIRAAVTDGDREDIAQEVAALVAAEVLDPDEAAQIKGAVAEARLSADAKRKNEPPPEDPSKLRLASPQAMNAAAALDRIVDDARFDRVLAYIAAELEADMVQHPNTDEGGA